MSIREFYDNFTAHLLLEDDISFTALVSSIQSLVPGIIHAEYSDGVISFTQSDSSPNMIGDLLYDAPVEWTISRTLNSPFRCEYLIEVVDEEEDEEMDEGPLLCVIVWIRQPIRRVRSMVHASPAA